MLFKNKKGEVASIILLVVVLIALVGYGIRMSGRQCNANIDCGEKQYCGSDFKCHDFQIIKVYKNDLVIPAVIVAAALVVGAVILKRKKDKEEKRVSYDYQVQQQDNPYYK
ncbi:hypothetical protein KY331_05010 [Candidatus Woesearchaeota archaeon]|nr:hypothetical protein [Candidatus Woesearchaeota archaeon]